MGRGGRAHGEPAAAALRAAGLRAHRRLGDILGHARDEAPRGRRARAGQRSCPPARLGRRSGRREGGGREILRAASALPASPDRRICHRARRRVARRRAAEGWLGAARLLRCAICLCGRYLGGAAPRAGRRRDLVGGRGVRRGAPGQSRRHHRRHPDRWRRLRAYRRRRAGDARQQQGRAPTPRLRAVPRRRIERGARRDPGRAGRHSRERRRCARPGSSTRRSPMRPPRRLHSPRGPRTDASSPPRSGAGSDRVQRTLSKGRRCSIALPSQPR